jgi:hypothetical protein
MKTIRYRDTEIAAYAVEVGGGKTGFQYRYRGEIERQGVGATEPFDSPEGIYFENSSMAVEQCLEDGRKRVDTAAPGFAPAPTPDNA